MTYEHFLSDLKGLETLLTAHGVTEAVIKPLSRNHNDKNQVYSGTDFRPLYPMFDLTFSLRGPSSSIKKASRTTGTAIPEAVFNSFVWLTTAGREVQARSVRMIIYPQYPETRLSGFQTVLNTMPESMSVSYTKAHPDAERYLVLGRRGQGEAVGVMVVSPGNVFTDEVGALPPATGSRVWKHLRLKSGAAQRLTTALTLSAGQKLKGCRLDSAGKTLPFNGTQVCGYTLEHALGIIPNSSKNGDFEGIELKTYTNPKVTLFTPEPDMGLYAADFGAFMLRFGYQDSDGHYRLTGVHRVGERSSKSGLTLKVINHVRGTALAASVDKNVHLGLIDDNGFLAAGWSLERILNNWTSKHNEAVYIPAEKSACDNASFLEEGYEHWITFGTQVMWCRDTSAERLFEALYNGTLFLDPAPKYSPDNPKVNKRRSQWRVNDIASAAKDLYVSVRTISVKDEFLTLQTFEN